MSPGMFHWCCCGADSAGVIGIIGKRRNSSNVYVPALLLIYYGSYQTASVDLVCAGDLYYEGSMSPKLSFDFFATDGLIVSSKNVLMMLDELPTTSTLPPAGSWTQLSNLIDYSNYQDVVAGINVQEGGDEWESYDLFTGDNNDLNRYYNAIDGISKEVIHTGFVSDDDAQGIESMFAARGPKGECGVTYVDYNTNFLMRADRPNGYGYGDGAWTISMVRGDLGAIRPSVCFGKTQMDIAYWSISGSNRILITTLPNPSFAAYPSFPIGGINLGMLDTTRFWHSIAYSPVTDEYSLTFAIQSAYGVKPAYTYILHYTYVDGAWSASPEIAYYVAARIDYFFEVKCLYDAVGNPWIIATRSDHALYIFHKNGSGAWERAFTDQSFGLWNTHTVRLKSV